VEGGEYEVKKWEVRKEKQECGAKAPHLRGEELGGHFEEEVEAEKEEDQVGGPGGEEWGELADAAHGFEEGGYGPVDDADADA
jgi:hypothetical protein